MRGHTAETGIARRRKHAEIINSSLQDGLSHLPDEVLTEVLGRLPVEDAFRTACLSKRWRHLPSLLGLKPHLLVGTPFSSPKQKLPPSISQDLDAIDRALSSETTYLAACEIVPEAVPDPLRVWRWAEVLAQRSTRKLVLDSRRKPGLDASPVVILCRSLFKLDLRACYLFPHTLGIWFRTPLPVGCVLLTDLRLVEVRVSDSALLGIAFACKMLARLELIGCKGLQRFRLQGVQSLKDLIVHCAADAVVGDLQGIEINAPNLEELDLKMLPPRHGVHIVAPKLRSVHLWLHTKRRRFFPATAPGLRRLLHSAPGISSLQVRGGVVDCLSVDRLPDSFNSPYLNLKRLYASLALKHDRQALCLAVLLQQFSKLEQLNVFIIKLDVHYGGGGPPAPEFKDHQGRLEQASCVRSSLQSLTMSGCTGDLYEMDFAAFILKNAQVLKKLTLSLNKSCSTAVESAANNLAHLVRASPTAKFVVKKSK